MQPLVKHVESLVDSPSEEAFSFKNLDLKDLTGRIVPVSEKEWEDISRDI